MSDYSKTSQFKAPNGQSENFECQECNKTFKYESHFLRHIQTHSESRPFECPKCQKKFKRQDALKTHERTHSDDLPFKCSREGCSESFASKAALRYHELRHTNETVFICDKDGCNKKFLTLGQLKQHQRTKIHAKQACPQMLGDFDSQNKAYPIHNNSHSLSSSGNIATSNSTNSGYQNQIYYSQAAAPYIQFSQPQQLYSLQNSSQPNFLYGNNVNLIQSMSDYLSNDNIPQSNSVPSSNSAPNISTLEQQINVKKEHRQEDTFLDDFSEDEQVFIDQIWSTIKQENTNNEYECPKKASNEFNNACDNAYHSDYPIQKRRRNNPVQSDNKINANANTNNLLMEFTGLNPSGSSFSRLKQELRIIVGLIDKIKKEDEELIPPASNHEDQHYIDNYSSNQQQQQEVSKNSEKRFNSCEFRKNSTDCQEDSNYRFYQNDDSPFHNYECQMIHNDIPSEVIDKDEKEQSNGYYKTYERPLLKKKIKTAVRFVQYFKKVFKDQKKQSIQQDQQQQQQKRMQIQTTQNSYTNKPLNNYFDQNAQFSFTPKQEFQQFQQQYDTNSQFSQQNTYNNYQHFQNFNVEDLYPKQIQIPSSINFTSSSRTNRPSSSFHFTQQPLLQNCQQTQNNFMNQFNNSIQKNMTTNYSLDPYRVQSQPQPHVNFNEMAPIYISSLNNTLADDSQLQFSDIDMNQLSEMAPNIFDAADEVQSIQLYSDQQFIPTQQFNACN
ncbi:hypothetical protein ABPG74_021174 [Tetrahymena malaccensis]